MFVGCELERYVPKTVEKRGKCGFPYSLVAIKRMRMLRDCNLPAQSEAKGWKCFPVSDPVQCYALNYENGVLGEMRADLNAVVGSRGYVVMESRGVLSRDFRRCKKSINI